MNRPTQRSLSLLVAAIAISLVGCPMADAKILPQQVSTGSSAGAASGALPHLPQDIALGVFPDGAAVRLLATTAGTSAQRVSVSVKREDGRLVPGGGAQLVVLDEGGYVAARLPKQSVAPGQRYRVSVRSCAVVEPTRCSAPLTAVTIARSVTVDLQRWLDWSVAAGARASAQVSAASTTLAAAAVTSRAGLAVPGSVTRLRAVGSWTSAGGARATTVSVVQQSVSSSGTSEASYSMVRESRAGTSLLYRDHPEFYQLSGAAAASPPQSVVKSAPQGMVTAASLNRNATVAWARDNYAEKHQYTPNCTGFASRALHFGGGLGYKTGWYRDDHHWWRQTAILTSQTYSWAGAQHQANFLGYNSGSWVKYTYQAVPGDIIYYRYPGFKEINHTAVITKVQPSTGQIWVTQSDTNYKDTSLSDQQARIRKEFKGNAVIFIRHVTF